MCSWLVIKFKFTPNYGVTEDSSVNMGKDLDFKHMRHFGNGSVNISQSIINNQLCGNTLRLLIPTLYTKLCVTDI